MHTGKLQYHLVWCTKYRRWTRSYYAGTIGHVSEETIKNYIENQRNI